MKGNIVLCSDLKEMEQAKKAGPKGILYQDCSKTPCARDYEKCPLVGLTKDNVKEIRQLIRYAKLILKLKTDCSYRYITLFFLQRKSQS